MFVDRLYFIKYRFISTVTKINITINKQLTIIEDKRTFITFTLRFTDGNVTYDAFVSK